VQNKTYFIIKQPRTQTIFTLIPEWSYDKKISAAQRHLGVKPCNEDHYRVFKF
jgi:hypothetical protein